MTIGSIQTSMMERHSELCIFGEFGVFQDRHGSIAKLVRWNLRSALTRLLPKAELCRPPWFGRIDEQSLPQLTDRLTRSAWISEMSVPFRVAQKTMTGFPTATLSRTGQSSLSRRLFKTHSLATAKAMICLTSLTGRYSSPNCIMSVISVYKRMSERLKVRERVRVEKG
jgi:hypothetical protein